MALWGQLQGTALELEKPWTREFSAVCTLDLEHHLLQEALLDLLTYLTRSGFFVICSHKSKVFAAEN